MAENNTIDTLSLEIKSDAQKASDGIERLASALAGLDKAAGRGLSGLLKLTSQMKNFSGYFSGMENISKTVKDLEQIGKVASNLSKTPVKLNVDEMEAKINSLKQQFADVGKDFSFTGNANDLVKEIETTSKQLDKLFEKEERAKNIGANIDSSSFKGIIYDISLLTNKMDILRSKLKEIESSEKPIDIAKLPEDQFSEWFKKLSSLQYASEETAKNIMEDFQKVGVSLQGLAYNPDAMAAVFGEGAAGITNWNDAMLNFGKNAGSALNSVESLKDSIDRTGLSAEQFETYLQNLKIPEIHEGNLKKLQAELDITERKLDELKVKSDNWAAKGINPDSTMFRKLQEEIVYTSKKADALKDKINSLGSSGGAKGGIDSLANSIHNLSFSSIRTISSIERLRIGLGSLLKALLPILGIRQLFNWGKQSIKIASDLAEVQNIVDVTFGDMKQKVEDLASTSIQDFGMSELTVKQISSRFQAMGVAMGFGQEKMSDMSIELTKLTADMASFYNVSQEDVAKSLESIFTGTARPLRQFGIDLTQATLQEWALAQGMNVNIQKMSQAEKAILRYQYVMANSTAAQKDFYNTSMSWANQIRILGQQFQQLGGIVGGVLINAFKPFVAALNSVMLSVVKFAKTVANALGAIFGWTIEIDAGGLATDFDAAGAGAEAMDKGTGGAAKNLKDMNKYIAAWHEVNNMTTSDDSGGGGGGGGAGGGGGDIGDAAQAQLKRTKGILDQYKSDIDSLYGLGKYIGEVLTKAMNDIDWNSVYESARNFGSGLAQFLNGLISPELFGALGRTIAGSLNTILHSLDSFGTTFDWKNFGNSIAAGVNEFFDTFDFNLLADTINTWANGLLDAIIEFLDETEWDKIGEKIGEFLEQINFLEIGSKVMKALWKALNAGFKMYEGMFEKAPLETALLTLVGLTKLLKTNKIKNFANVLNDGIKTVKNFGDAFLGSRKALSDLQTGFPKLSKVVDALGDSFQRLMLGIHFGDFAGGINAALENIRNNLSGTQKFAITAVAALGEFALVKDSISDIVTGSGNLLLNIAKLITVVGAAGVAMYTTLGPAGIVISAVIGLSAAILGVNDAINKIADNEAGEIIANNLSNPGGKSISEISDEYKDMFDKISDGYDGLVQKSEEIEAVKESSEKTAKSIDSIKFAIENGAYTAEEKIPEMQNLFSQLLTESQSIFQEEYDLIVMGLSGSFGDALQSAGISIGEYTAMLSSLKTDVEQVYDEVIKSNQELQTAYDNGQITAEEYYRGLENNREKLSKVTVDTDKLNESVQAVSDAIGGVDFSEFINEDNAFELQTFSDIMGTLATSASESKDQIVNANSGLMTSLQDYQTIALQMGDTLSASKIGESMEVISTDIANGTKEIDSKLVEFGNTVQTELVGKIPGIIDSAIQEWDQKSWFEKMLTPKDEYVKHAVDNYKTGFIDPAMGEIQTMYEQAGVDASAWGGNAAQTAIDNMFSVLESYSDVTGPSTMITLKDNYTEIFNDALEGAANEVKPTIEGVGGQIDEDLGVSITNNKEVVEASAMDLANSAITSASTTLGSGDNSAFGNMGKEAVGDFNGGVSNNTESTNEIMNKWVLGFAGYFTKLLGINSPSTIFQGYGKNTVEGFNEGVDNNKESTQGIIGGWVSKIKGWFTNALDINSPSGVFEDFAKYTVLGFNEGLEDNMDSSFGLVKSWSDGITKGFDFQVPQVDLSVPQMDYDYTAQDMNDNVKKLQYTMQMDMDSNKAQQEWDLKQQNELLQEQNELLRAILNKPTLQNRDLFNAVQSEGRQYVKQNKKDPWPVMGRA